MNPELKLFLILIISLEISLVPNLGANLIIIGACLIYLLFKHINLKKLFLLFIIPLFAAFVVLLQFTTSLLVAVFIKLVSYLREFTPMSF